MINEFMYLFARVFWIHVYPKNVSSQDNEEDLGRNCTWLVSPHLIIIKFL